jgi:hypothetical protein
MIYFSCLLIGIGLGDLVRARSSHVAVRAIGGLVGIGSTVALLLLTGGECVVAVLGAVAAAGWLVGTSTPRFIVRKLVRRALRLGREKDAEEWLHSTAVKNQILRMDPKFSEKSLGHSNFTKFLESRSKVVELKEEGGSRMVRLRETDNAANGSELRATATEAGS